MYCEYCSDPATRIKKIKESFWPFAIKSLTAYCKECYQEIHEGKTPKVTNPSIRSKKGSGIKWRHRE